MKIRKHTLLRAFVATGLGVVGAVGVAPVSVADTRCFTSDGPHASSRTCHTVDKRYNRVFAAGYRDGVNNRKNYAISASCTASSQTTQRYSLSSSIEGEASGIFVTIRASISAEISKEMSSGYSTSTQFKVPRHSYVYCDRGILNERVAGHTVAKVCEHQGMCETRRNNWTARAHSRALWRIYS